MEKQVIAYIWLVLSACLHSPEPKWTVVEEPTPATDSGTSTLVEAVGLETLGGVFTALLPQGCRLPCSTTETFSTAVDDQDEIKLTLFRSADAKMVAEATRLGQFEIRGIPRAPRGTPQIAVTFEARDNQLRVVAKDTANDDLLLSVTRLPE